MCLLRERLGQSLQNKLNIEKNTEVPGNYAEKTELLRPWLLNL